MRVIQAAIFFIISAFGRLIKEQFFRYMCNCDMMCEILIAM